MNAYPGFYKTKDGDTYLHLNEFNYYSLITSVWERDIEIEGHESDTNITREYLANTYGEVESKEHAEFIVKLAEGAGFAVDICYLEGRKFFSFYGDVLLFSEQYDPNKKKITIPLPPKEPEPKEWPQVGDDVAWSPKLSRKGTLLNVYEGMAWIKDSYGEFVSIEVNKLKKPLTPEEELAKELEKMVYDGMDNSYDLNHNCYYLVSGLMKKYDIKKKPE